MRYILTLVGGVVLGAALIFFFFTGAPGARSLPGAPVQAPEGAPPPGTALVTLDERFFDTLLGTIFNQVGAPAFPLRLSGNRQELAPAPSGAGEARFLPAQGGGCPGYIVLEQEGSGVRTGVRFADGRIVVPLAFNGSYSLPLLGCVNFRGWAQANVVINFAPEQQTVYGQINVESVNLEGAPTGASPFITPLVQQAINQQLNPLEILRAPQLAVPVPVQTGAGTLHARVREVRAEIADNLLRLHITYDFSGTPTGQPPPG